MGYSFGVLKTATQRGGTRRAEEQRSPTRALLFGLIITLAAVVAYSAYITVQISGLRKLQSELVDRNRRDSLEQLRLPLQARQAALSTAVSRLLVENNEGEQRAASQIGEIYTRVQRQVYLFFAATLIAIVLTSLYLIRTNREIFARLAALSEQRSDLAQKLISTQESTLRHISRELHDEF